MKADYLKIPVEMASFALSAHKATAVKVFCGSQFLYSGKARTSDRPARTIGNFCDLSERTVYRKFDWLLGRNWFGKDSVNGWYFFRGFDRIYGIEDWQYRRAGILYPKDLQAFKPYLAGLVLASLVHTETAKRKERLRGGSIPTALPVSAKAFAKTLDVSTRYAQNLRKLATDNNYVNSRINLVPLRGFNAVDVKRLQGTDIGISTDRLRTFDGQVFIQKPNLIKPLIHLRSR